MYELEKIKEAEYFYCQMIKEKDNRDNLKFNLSAFLSSARSVLQYAYKEVKDKNGGPSWYNSQVSNNKALTFFKDKRDINIHTEPVSVKRDIAIHLSETIHIGDPVLMTVKDKEGNVKSQSRSYLQPFKSAVDNKMVEIKYIFEDWVGDEDMFFICQEYLKELKAVVEDGKNRGLLT